MFSVHQKVFFKKHTEKVAVNTVVGLLYKVLKNCLLQACDVFDVKMFQIWTFPSAPSTERVPSLAEWVAYLRYLINLRLFDLRVPGLVCSQFDPVIFLFQKKTFLFLTGGASISNYAQYHKILEYVRVLNLKCESSSGNADWMELRRYDRRTDLFSYLSIFCIFFQIDSVASHSPNDMNKC